MSIRDTSLAALLIPDVSGLSARQAAHEYLEAGLMPHPWRVKRLDDGSLTKASAYFGFSFGRETVYDPSTPKGERGCLVDEAAIRAWRPSWRCGLAVSWVSGLFAIDVDDIEAFDAWELAASLTTTAKSRTGREEGGYHLLFDGREIGEDDWPRQGNIPGGQIKSNGFIAVEPSLHPSGNAYRWVRRRVADGTKVARALARWQASQNGHSGVRDRAKIVRDAATAAPGLQHDSLRDYAWDLRIRELTEQEALLLLRYSADQLEQGKRRGAWTDQDLLALYRTAMANPAGVGISRGQEARDLDALAELADWEPAPAPVRTGYGPGGAVLAPIPEYPIINGVLGRLVKTAKQLPPALVGGAGLAALAAACSEWTLRMPDGSLQNPVLWVPLIAPPGAGKTPALELAFECLRDLDESTMRDYFQERSEWAQVPKDERGPEPRDQSLIIDDFTLERLARRLDNSGGRACVVSDELSGFLGGFGRYGAGGGKSERSRMLTLWSAKPWRYERVAGQVDIYVKRPVVSVVGGIQPDYQGQLGGDQDGMRTRWLPHFEPEGDAEYGEERAPAKWVNRLAELYCGDGMDLVLDGDALASWRTYAQEWREAKRAKGVSKTLFEALSKADQQLARIALVLGAAGGDSELLSEVWVHEAARIVNYCIGVWAALPAPEVFALSERDRIMRGKITQLVAWLERHEGQAKREEILHAQVAGIETGADLTDLLKAYNRAYPGCVARPKTGKRGRPAEIVTAPGRQGD